MTTLEIKAMIDRYEITDNGDGNMRIANGTEAQKNAAAIKSAKPEILAYLAADKLAKDESRKARQNKKQHVRNGFQHILINRAAPGIDHHTAHRKKA